MAKRLEWKNNFLFKKGEENMTSKLWNKLNISHGRRGKKVWAKGRATREELQSLIMGVFNDHNRGVEGHIYKSIVIRIIGNFPEYITWIPEQDQIEWLCQIAICPEIGDKRFTYEAKGVLR